MKKYTPTIILGFIGLGFMYLASIFGVDTILSLGSHATISEWIYNFTGKGTDLSILWEILGAFVIGWLGFIAHIKWFKPKDDSEK